MTIVRVSIALAESVARWLDKGMPKVGTKEWSREEVDSFEGSRDDERAIEDYNEDCAGAEEDTEDTKDTKDTEDTKDYAGVEEDDEDKKTEDNEDHNTEDHPLKEDPTAEEKPPTIILGTASTLASSIGSLEPLLQAIAPTMLYIPIPLLGTLGSLVDRFSLEEWKSRKKKQFSLGSRITLT
jgi:hypothetical protein